LHSQAQVWLLRSASRLRQRQWTIAVNVTEVATSAATNPLTEAARLVCAKADAIFNL
jgi:hypothetical protein